MNTLAAPQKSWSARQPTLFLVFAAVVWLAQVFGGVLTSQGTDVNSGPLIALLAWIFWPLSTRHDARPR